MMKTRAFGLIVLMFLLAPLFVRAEDGNAGTRPFSFVNLDYDARAMAMAGASIAMPNDLYGIFTNPAAGGFITKHQVFCGVRSVIQDVFGGPVGYALPSSYGTFGINIVSISYGSLQETDEANSRPVFTDKTAHWYSASGQISWSRTVMENLALGAALCGFYDHASTSLGSPSAQAASVQAGMQYRFYDSRLIWGVVLSNAGFMISGYSSETDNLKLPLTLSTGISYTPYYVPTLRIALDLQQTADAYLMYKPGIEFAIYKKYLYGRAGYRFSERDLEEVLKVLQGESTEGYQKSTWYGPSFGIGCVTDINRYNVSIDAAVQFNDIEPAFGLTLMLDY